MDEICLPGNTLLWDLLQDQNIVSIAAVVLDSLGLFKKLICFSIFQLDICI